MRREAAAARLRVHRDGHDSIVRVRRREIDVWVEGLVAEDLLRAWIEEVAPNVRLGIATAVGVHDVDLCRAAGEQPVDDGIEIRGEHLLSLRIPLRMTEQEGAPILLAGEAFHVVVDEDSYP